MEDHIKRSESSTIIDLLKPVFVNEKKMSFQELKNEYTKAFNYIDTLRTEKNNLIDNIKALSSQKFEPASGSSYLSSPKIPGHIKTAYSQIQNEKKMIQLEQENRELRKMLSENHLPFNRSEMEKKLVILEQENAELKKDLEMRLEEILMLEKENPSLKRLEVERLDKSNRQLRSQVEFLNVEISTLSKRLQELEEENSRICANSSDPSLGLETHQAVIKYMNYILNTVNAFPPYNATRSSFEERFATPLDVHRLLNAKDYVSLLLKSLKFISDIFITNDPKASLDVKANLKKSLNTSDHNTSQVSEKKNEANPAPKKKTLTSSKSTTSLSRSSTSGLNILNTTPQTPSNISGQEKVLSAGIKPQIRTNNQQQVNCINTTKESHIIYAYNQKARNSKDSSLLQDGCLNTRENSSILNNRRSSQTSRNGSPLLERSNQEEIRSPQNEYRSSSMEKKRYGVTFEENPQNTPVSKTLAEKSRFLKEKENQLLEMDRELQEKGKRLRELSRDLDRRETLTQECFSNTGSSTNQRKSSHKRVNTESFSSSKMIGIETEDKLNMSKNGQEDDERTVIRLRPVLKVPTYDKRENENNYEIDFRGSKTVKNEEGVRFILNDISEQGVSRGNYVPSRNNSNTESANNLGYVEANERRLKNVAQRPASELRPRMKSGSNHDGPYYREDQREDRDRCVKISRNQDYLHKEVEDPVYQPKVLPRPQPRDKLEELSASVNNTAWGVQKNRHHTGNGILDGLEDSQHKQFTFEMDEGDQGNVLSRKSSSKRIETFKSPTGSVQPRGSNSSSKIPFGRSEVNPRLPNAPQEKRPKSPSILDVVSKKRVNHVVQTYDIIRGEDIKNSKGEVIKH